jgi:hypothetical protein
LDERRFRVNNIPIFVSEVSYGDIVSVSEDRNGALNFHAVIEEGGHSTLRVIFLENDADTRSITVRASDLGELLRKNGCEFQVSRPPEILAIDIPPSVSIEVIRGILQRGEVDGLWNYEEGTLADSERLSPPS